MMQKYPVLCHLSARKDASKSVQSTDEQGSIAVRPAVAMTMSHPSSTVFWSYVWARSKVSLPTDMCDGIQRGHGQVVPINRLCAYHIRSFIVRESWLDVATKTAVSGTRSSALDRLAHLSLIQMGSKLTTLFPISLSGAIYSAARCFSAAEIHVTLGSSASPCVSFLLPFLNSTC